MLGSIKYNLSHLLDFRGRDARQTFWFYVLFLFIVYMVVSMVGGVLLIGSLLGPIIDTANTALSEQEAQAQVSAQMATFMSRMFGALIWVSAIVNVIMDALLAAAFVRRVHDSNSSGWWAVGLLLAQIAGLAAMIPMMDAMQDVIVAASNPANAGPAQMQNMMAVQSRFGVYPLIGWIPTIMFVVFGVLPSTDGPNRYGEAPARF